MIEGSLFCKYCPCAWCEVESGEESTGVKEFPNLNICRNMFEKEPELTFEEFVTSIFELNHARGGQRYV